MDEHRSTTPSLLGELQSRCELPYLSDLRLPEYRQRLEAALERFEPENYPLEEWEGCWRYLIGKNPPEKLELKTASRRLWQSLRREV